MASQYNSEQMSLPQLTEILIVGAGPTGVWFSVVNTRPQYSYPFTPGLALALSLHKEGWRDMVIVDALECGENTSRALAIHAATLEVCWHLMLLPFPPS